MAKKIEILTGNQVKQEPVKETPKTIISPNYSTPEINSVEEKKIEKKSSHYNVIETKKPEPKKEPEEISFDAEEKFEQEQSEEEEEEETQSYEPNFNIARSFTKIIIPLMFLVVTVSIILPVASNLNISSTTTASYSAGDLGNMAIDLVGGILNGLGSNAYTIGSLVVITVILVIVVDLLTGVFNIFDFMRGR